MRRTRPALLCAVIVTALVCAQLAPRTLAAPSTYILTVSARPSDSGSTDPGIGIHVYAESTSVRIIAYPFTGYRFDRWSGSASGTDNETTVTMDSDKSVIANFALRPSASNPGCDGKPSPATGITNRRPQLSWSYAGTYPQVRYHLQVGTSPENNDMWDTDPVDNASKSAKYDGATLASGTVYYWRVRVSDNVEWSGWVAAAFRMSENLIGPSITSVSLAGGAGYTRSPDVALTISTTGVAAHEMCTSFDRAAWDNWTPFAENTRITLPGGDGEKTVYVRLRDAGGNESGIASDNIVLDATPPVISAEYPQEGAAITEASPTLRARVVDAVRVDTYSATVDNASAECTYDSATHILEVPCPPLGVGLHAVVVSASDPAGGTTVYGWSFTVGATLTTTLRPARSAYGQGEVIDVDLIVVNLSSVGVTRTYAIELDGYRCENEISVAANGTGTFRFVLVPPENLAPGVKTICLYGENSQLLTSVNITIKGAANGPRPGEVPWYAFVIAVVAPSVVIALVLWSRRRARGEEEHPPTELEELEKI